MDIIRYKSPKTLLFLASFMLFGWIFGSYNIVDIKTTNAENLTPAERAQLEAELKSIEKEVALAQDKLVSAQSQSASFSRDIAILDAKIKAAQLDIKAKNLLIKTLGNDITDKQNHINNLDARITKGKEALADLLRKTDELGNNSISEVLLSQTSVSDFFTDLDSFQTVQQGLQDTFERLRDDVTTTKEEKSVLDTKRNSTIDARHAIEVQQANIKSDQAQQKQLLAISKNNEKSYKTLVSEKQSRIAEIRSALFALSGAQAIPFGDALNYANAVYQKTGVSPAFLLAIITQESNLGKNVGTCYMTNTADGSGINTRTQARVEKVMKPTRDVQPFLDVTSALGLSYSTVPVSCPQSIGYGGAMGPAQFIASTWVLPSIKNRLIKDLGINGMPNPWKPLDAFMASGIYLSDLGADTNSYSAQKNAACKYYSGRACGYVTGATSYGNSVMALADSIQRDKINPLLGL